MREERLSGVVLPGMLGTWAMDGPQQVDVPVQSLLGKGLDGPRYC